MNIEIRNQFGFPIVPKLEKAKQYAAAARERNKPQCDCPTCRQIEMLPAVINITNNWSKE